MLYAPDGTLNGVRHAWTFDDMFSIFATQGLEAKKKGEFTREELAPLAKVNVESLKEYDFFTYATANGKKIEFNEPAAGYYLVYDPKETVLTLHFELPLKSPIKTKDLEHRGLRPRIFRRLQPRREGPGQARRSTGAVQAHRRQAAGNGRRPVAAIEPARPRPARPVADHRLRIRQQDSCDMPLNSAGGGRLALQLALVVAAVAGVLLIAGALEAVWAQAGPFGVPRSQSAPAQSSGLIGWILLKQAEFYKQFSGLIRAAKTDGSAAWSLFGLSFLYGVFHAAGPGHGKAVISSYMIANEETWRRGVVLSFASAFLQALVAVVFVGIAAVMLNATAANMKTAVNWIEMLSYALIVLIGVRLLWVKGRALIAEARRLHSPKTVGARRHAADQRHDHGHHAHAHHGHAHHGHAHHGHATTTMIMRISDHADCGHDHGHASHAHHHHDHGDDASAWGHAHAPEPEELAGPGGWKRGLSAVVAVGLRPCSGAILVLVFALAQGLFWAGVVSTFIMGLGTAITVAVIATIAVSAKALAGRLANARSGYGMLAMRAHRSRRRADHRGVRRAAAQRLYRERADARGEVGRSRFPIALGIDSQAEPQPAKSCGLSSIGSPCGVRSAARSQAS